MHIAVSLVAVLLLAAAGPAWAQPAAAPPGAYRTAAAYHRRQPAPAGTDAYYPDKRGLLVVVPLGRGPKKLRLAPDSTWGYVSGKGRTVRFYRGEEYQLEHADTLCVYSSTAVPAGSERADAASTAPVLNSGRYLNTAPPRYFFSRGLKGLVFPLTLRYLREMYAASNPDFAAALARLRFAESLSDRDSKTGLFRVTVLYRGTLR